MLAQLRQFGGPGAKFAHQLAGRLAIKHELALARDQRKRPVALECDSESRHPFSLENNCLKAGGAEFSLQIFSRK